MMARLLYFFTFISMILQYFTSSKTPDISFDLYLSQVGSSVMMDKKKKLKGALFLNMLIVFFESYALFQAFFNADGGFNWHFLQYYCHIANICTLISSLLVALELMKELQSNMRERTSYISRVLKFASTTAMVFSFFITVLVLVPFDSFGKGRLYLLSGYYFFEHLLCPLLSFLTITVFGDYADFGRKESLIAVVPTFLYASVMFLLNALKIMEAPFPFFSVYSQSWYVSLLWFTALVAFSFGCAWLLVGAARIVRIRTVVGTDVSRASDM